jgi:glycosyltransferase involved in cell wall biosynthesis
MAKMYGGFDVTLHATRSEGFGVCIIESNACGTPCIGTDFTTMPELIKGHGWLVKPVTKHFSALHSLWAIPDEFEIAKALTEAYNNPKKLKKYGKKARKHSLQYDISVVGPLWARLFEDVRDEMSSYGISSLKDKSYEDKLAKLLEDE